MSARMAAFWESLGARILAWMAPAALVVTGGTFALLIHLTHQRDVAALSARAEAVARLQADALALPLWNLDEAQIQATLRALSRDAAFVGVEVRDPSGRRIAEAWVGCPPASGAEPSPTGEACGPGSSPPPPALRQIEARAPVTYRRDDRTERLGDLALWFTTAGVEAQLRSLILIGAASMVVLILTLGLAAILVLRGTVFRPLGLLRDGLAAVATENRHRIGWTSRSELGLAIESFNEMVEQLELGDRAKRALADAERSVARARAEEAKADAASRAKSEFLANMSHELRTPLNAIIGYATLLKEDMQDAGLETYMPDIENIQGASQHLLSLINDVLDLSKIEAGRMELFVERFDIADMIRDVVAVAAPLVSKNDNRFIVDCPDSLGALETDLTKLRQCLVNLLGNAAKFTEHGVVTLTVRRAGDRVRFYVADTGIGMSPEQQARLFSAFVQADSEITRRFGGTGLGLALTASFARLLGGGVSVDSAPGKGSTFVIDVAADAGAARDAQSAGHGDGRAEVLVIDDDDDALATSSRALEAAGFRVVCANTPEQGMELARARRPALIVLDIIMPRIDGWRVLASLRADPQTSVIPVILASVTPNRDLGIMLGAVDFLPKPIDNRELIAAVSKVLGGEPSGTVLLVDDSEHDRAPMARSLRRAGIPVIEARDGAQAIEVLHLQRPSVVLLDLAMPGTDGFEVLSRLDAREDLRDLPVIVVTGCTLSPQQEAVLEARRQQILRKGTFSSTELVDLVTRRIGRQPPPETPESSAA